MNFDYEQLEQKMNSLPKEIKTALTSTDVSTAIKEIGDKYGLKLDQESVLFDLVAYTMLGLSPSKDFVKNLSREADVNTEAARSIAQDINNEVFSSIKEHMRKVEMGTEVEAELEKPEENPEIVAVEQAGDFEILKDDAEAGVGATVSTIQGPAGMKMTVDSAHTDIIADHLLNNPVAVKREKIVRTADDGGTARKGEVPENLPTEESGSGSKAVAGAEKVEKRGYGIDPYREPIK